MRISRDSAMFSYAAIAAQRSSCLRRQVGAVIFDEGRPIVAGYNGAPSQVSHCTPEICNEDSPCTRTVHAEANCIAFAARKGLATEGTVMVCTASPCLDCAKLIINAGITELCYIDEYRDVRPIIWLMHVKINIRKWTYEHSEFQFVHRDQIWDKLLETQKSELHTLLAASYR